MPRSRLALVDPPAAAAPRTKRRRSPAQAAAARRNGARSQGPLSEGGRRISAMNAFAHGLCSTTLGKLEGEDAQAYATFLDNYRAELEPYGWDGIDAADRMARSAWQVRRADQLMARALDEVLAAAEDGEDGLLGALERHRGALALLQRYRAAAARDIARCAWLIESAKRRRDREARDVEAEERRLRALAEDAARRRHEALWGIKPSDHGAPDPRGPLSPHVYALDEAPPPVWRNEPEPVAKPAAPAADQAPDAGVAGAAAGPEGEPAEPVPPPAGPAAMPTTKAEARERMLLALLRGTLKTAREARSAARAADPGPAEEAPVRRRERRRSARSPG